MRKAYKIVLDVWVLDFCRKVKYIQCTLFPRW